MQGWRGADAVCFEGAAAEKKQAACSSETRISAMRNRPGDLKGLMICLSDSGCMTAWLDGSSYGWSLSKKKKDRFRKSLTGPDNRETPASVD